MASDTFRSRDGAPLLRGAGPDRRLTLPLLEQVPDLAHGFTVRGSDPPQAIHAAAGHPLPLRTLRQVHGHAVHVVKDSADPIAAPAAAEGDALVTRARGVALGVWVADCVPILLCDPEAGTVGAVHAGWRGTAAGVLQTAIDALERLGARPARLRIAFGPAIGPCCFEVGEEVVEAIATRDSEASAFVRPGARPHLDLIEANRRQAVARGVEADRMQAAGLCTVCRNDLLESYRRGRGTCGRMAGFIGWRR